MYTVTIKDQNFYVKTLYEALHEIRRVYYKGRGVEFFARYVGTSVHDEDIFEVVYVNDKKNLTLGKEFVLVREGDYR